MTRPKRPISSADAKPAAGAPDVPAASYPTPAQIQESERRIMVQLEALQSAVAELQTAVQAATAKIQELSDQLAGDADQQAQVDQIEQQVYDSTTQLRDAAGPVPGPDDAQGGAGPAPATPATPAARPPAAPPAGPPARPAPPSGRRVGGT